MVTSVIFMTMKATPKRERLVPAGEFKAKCLALFEEVESKGHSFVVTKRGRPVARVVPLSKGKTTLVGSLLEEGDLLAPVDVKWEAAR